jgi:hypothetical protein
MAISTTATQAELRTAYDTVHKLAICLRQYADGSATPTKPGRFTETEVQAAVDAVQAALTAIKA